MHFAKLHYMHIHIVEWCDWCFQECNDGMDVQVERHGLTAATKISIEIFQLMETNLA